MTLDPPPTRPAAPRGAEGRVARVQGQARRTLALAALFTLAAAVAVAVPHGTGRWLPLHLFLAGGLLIAVSGAAQLFAVTWAAGEPPSDRAAAAQRWLLAAGAAGLAAAREADAPRALAALAGGAILAALAFLLVLLEREVRSGVQRRFDPARRWYRAALASGLAGGAVGVALAAGTVGGADVAAAREAHAALNLLGLVGLVVAGTLPFFAATEARVKVSRRASPAAQAALLAWLASAVAVAAGALAAGRPGAAAAGLGAYAAGVVALVALLPPVGRKQLSWAGPRLLHLGAGLAWWAGAVVAAAARAGAGDPPFSATVLAVLVVGGYAQILAGALAYLAPVLRGGGHRRLAAGFARTRSWPGLVAANAAAALLAADAPAAAAAAGGVWVLDAAARAAGLAMPPAANAPAVGTRPPDPQEGTR